MKLIFKYISRTILAFFGLIGFNYIGGSIGVMLGVNVLNTLLIGIFGFWGLGFALLLKWFYP